MQSLKLRKPSIDEIERTKTYVHQIFRDKFYRTFKGFKKTHTSSNMHLVHIGDEWWAVAQNDPVSYKILEEKNATSFFHYMLQLQLRSTTKILRDLEDQYRKVNLIRELHCSEKRLQLATKRLHNLRDEWNLTYQVMHVAYQSVVASVDEHVKEEIKYLKRYLRMQRKKRNRWQKIHKVFMKPVRHELYLYHKSINM